MVCWKILTAGSVWLLAAACADVAGTEHDQLGRYTLYTIDGKRPPMVFRESANARFEFLSGALRLNADQTFTDSTEFRITPMYLGGPLPGGEVTHRFDVAWGLYRISGDTLYLNSLRGEHYHMIFQSGGSLKQELSGSVLQYRPD